MLSLGHGLAPQPRVTRRGRGGRRQQGRPIPPQVLIATLWRGESLKGWLGLPTAPNSSKSAAEPDEGIPSSSQACGVSPYSRPWLSPAPGGHCVLNAPPPPPTTMAANQSLILLLVVSPRCPGLDADRRLARSLRHGVVLVLGCVVHDNVLAEHRQHACQGGRRGVVGE